MNLSLAGRTTSSQIAVVIDGEASAISRYVVADRAESVVGAGISHPRRADRERIREEQFAAMPAQDADEYRLRS